MARAPHPAEDLGRFIQVAEQLYTRHSLRDVAASLGMPPQSLSDAINRLEDFFGETLIERPPSARVVKLTASGQLLADKMKNCLEPIQGESRLVQVKLAHSLVQSRELLSILNAFNQNSEGTAGSNPKGLKSRLVLSAGIDLDDSRETENLLTGQLDLLLCWALPQRIGKWKNAKGITFREIGPRFPFALISHSRHILEKCLAPPTENGRPPDTAQSPINFREFIRRKCAVLDHDKQPLDEFLVAQGLYYFGKQRIHNRSFLSIIQNVRAQIADVGIVPLIGSDLDVLEAVEEVFYQPLHLRDGGVRIAAVYREPIEIEELSQSASDINARTAIAAEIADAIDSTLTKNSANLLAQESAHRISKAKLRPLPVSDPRWYSSLTHGYYLYRDDDTAGNGISNKATWHYETVQNLSLDFKDGELVLAGQDSVALIKNTRNEEYRIEEARLVDGALFLVSRERSTFPGSRKRGFISIFNAAVEPLDICGMPLSEKIPAVIVGMWNGGGGRGNALATWSSIFSSVPLSLEALNVIARSASATFTFVEQPPYGADENCPLIEVAVKSVSRPD
jgi:hypothetical protein